MAGAAGAAGAGGAAGGPPWWETSCPPNPEPELEPLPACQERRYHVVIVDARGSDLLTSSTPVALNNFGQVAGTWNPGSDLEEWEAFFWDRGVRTDFHADPNITFSFASDINNHGAMVGRVTIVPSQGSQPFIYADGVETRLPLSGNAGAINDLGDVLVGSSVYIDGTLHALPHDPEIFVSAVDINNHRQVVGTAGPAGDPRPFLFSCGEMRDLGSLGGLAGEAVEINERGQIVGAERHLQGPDTPFLYENGQMTPLPIELGRNLDINNRGEISGERFVYADGQLHDVPTQVIGTPCWRSFVIEDINDHGDLAVLVRRCPVGDEDPGRDAIILTMNPERYTQ